MLRIKKTVIRTLDNLALVSSVSYYFVFLCNIVLHCRTNYSFFEMSTNLCIFAQLCVFDGRNPTFVIKG